MNRAAEEIKIFGSIKGLHLLFSALFFSFLPLFRVKFYFSFWFWCVLLLVTFSLIGFNKGDKGIYEENIDYLKFLMVAAVSSAFNSSFAFFSICLEYILIYFLYFVIKFYSKIPKFNYIIIFLLLIQWGFQCILGYMQSIGDERFFFIDASYLNENTNINLLSAATFTASRVWGIFYNSLDFANYMTPLSIYLFASLFNSDLRGKYFIAVLFLFFSGWVITLSGSRTSFFVYLILAFWFVYLKSRNLFTISIVFLLLGFILTPVELTEDIALFQRLRGEYVADDARVDLFLNAIVIFFDNPIFGIGIGNVTENFIKYGFAADGGALGNFDHVESVYLTLLLSVGVFGSFFMFRFMFLPVFHCLKMGGNIIREPAVFAYLAMLLTALSEPSTLTNFALFSMFIYYRVKIVNFYSQFLFK